MAYKKTIVVTIKDGDGKVVAVDQMPLPPNSTTDLVSEIEIVDVPPRMQRQERSPLHPRALRLSDLHVGMKIRVCGKLGITKYTGIVAGESFSDDIGEKIPLVVIEQGPLGYEGTGYCERYTGDMGLTPYEETGRRPWWNPIWYTVAAR